VAANRTPARKSTTRKQKPARAKSHAKVKGDTITLNLAASAYAALEKLGKSSREIHLVGQRMASGQYKMGIRKGRKFVALNRHKFILLPK
jgi:ribosomal protein L28